MGLLAFLRRRRNKRVPFAHSWEPTRTPAPTVQVIDGRRYLTNSPYLLPKDVLEASRLDFQHYLLRSLLHSNYAAPLRADIKEILDIGCGTGRWVREMATAFSHAQVIGFDLDPPQRTLADPANCHFLQGDVLAGLPYSDHRFDYVHQRLLVAVIPAQRWPSVLKELVRVTRPGGYVELLEAGHHF